MTRPQTPRATRVAAYASALAAIALLTWFAWDRGPDPLIDFGRELYVPWRLTEGDVLHREIGWFNGPLGPWVLEGWMRLFGPTFDAVQALNALVVLVTAWLLSRLIARVANGGTAWLAVIVFASVFALAQLESTGNYIFLAPYSHGITFGFAAACGAILAVLRGVERRSLGHFALAGAAAGLAFLTKAEIFLGLFAALFAGVVALAVRPPAEARRAAWAGAFALGFGLALGLAFARFALQLGSTEAAFVALVGPWRHALDPELSSLAFYARMRGTADVGRSLTEIALATVGTAAFLAATLGAASVIGRRVSLPPRALVVGGVLLGAAATVGVAVVAPTRSMLLPLVPLLPTLVAVAAVRSLRGLEPKRFALLLFAAFALGLLPKIALVPLARQYGFVLALPGALLLLVTVVHFAPRLARSAPGARLAATGAGAGIALAFALLHVNTTRNMFATRTAHFGAGPDRIVCNPWRGELLEVARQYLAAELRPGETLLVLPEGIVLNHALRVRTPGRVVNFMPPELIIFGEDAIVADFEASPPDVVVFVHRPTDIYGFPFIGEGYGERIVEWVRARYSRQKAWGIDPFVGEESSGFGVEVWRPAGR